MKAKERVLRLKKKQNFLNQTKGQLQKKTNPTVHKLSPTTQNKTRMFALTNIFNIILEVLGSNYTKKKKKVIIVIKINKVFRLKQKN